MAEEAFQEVKTGLRELRYFLLEDENLDLLLKSKNLLNLCTTPTTSLNIPFFVWLFSGKDRYLTVEMIGDFLEDYLKFKNSFLLSNSLKYLNINVYQKIENLIIKPCDKLIYALK